MAATDCYFYKLVKKITLDTKLFKLPNTYGNSVNLIIFCRAALDDPKCEPVGIYYSGGVKKYLWQDKVWTEVDIYDKLLKRKAIDLVQNNLISLSYYDDIIEYLMMRQLRFGRDNIINHGVDATALIKSN